MTMWAPDENARRQYMAGYDLKRNPAKAVFSQHNNKIHLFEANETLFLIAQQEENLYRKAIQTRIYVEYIGETLIDGRKKALVMKLDGTRELLRVDFERLKKDV